ncbi:DUF808 domain-containing protein [Myxococcota bacterium]|nr:DUF808 domain-containing protein [Myxococcota bacterium]
MPVSGLLALLDDIATIADDVATLTALSAKKTTGIVTDDMAVTAEQAIGIRREREIPVVVAVAKGSMFNKGVILAPAALLLNAVAPWAITPLLMAGGAFLSFEGVEKIVHKLSHHDEHGHEAGPSLAERDPEAFEKERVKGAIRTDLILSGEIIAITLGEVTTSPFTVQVAVLYGISVIMTVGVYGLVAALIKLDDLGEALVTRGGSSAGPGRLILAGAPKLMRAISIIGTVAMLMVGGHIVRKGIPPLYDAVHHAIEALPHALHGVAGIGADIVSGAVVGLLLVGVAKTGVLQAAWRAVRPAKPKT